MALTIVNAARWWRRPLPLIFCILLSPFFISAQQSSSKTLDPRTAIPIITVTEDDMFPRHWLKAPIRARATSLSRTKMQRSLKALSYAMNKYPVASLRNDIKRIYLLSSLRLYGIACDASISSDSIYIATGSGVEYVEDYLVLTFERAFADLIAKKKKRARDPGTADAAHFDPQWGSPSADRVMKLVYKGNKGSPGYIYALENTGFTGITLFKQFKYSPRRDAITCQFRCRDIRRTLPVSKAAIRQDYTAFPRLPVDTAPIWSHDGKQIAFQSTRDHGVFELYVMNADGSKVRRLTHIPYVPYQYKGFSNPVWSCDDRQLAYVLSDEGPRKLFVVNADGTQQRRLPLDNGVNTRILLIGWLPDRRILFQTEGSDGIGSIHSILPDGTGLTPLIERGTPVRGAFLAPNQTLIAMYAGYNLIIKDLKSNTLCYSTSFAPFTMIHSETWSPDSKRFAYSGDGGLVIIDLESNTTRSHPIVSYDQVTGESKPQIGITSLQVSDISWSPDGNQIAYVLKEAFARSSIPPTELRVVKVDGTGGRHLSADGSSPVWSPDGKFIVFSRWATGLYLVGADGSGERHVSRGINAKWIP